MVTTKRQTKLTTVQREFLKHHGIGGHEVFDATGMQPRHYKPQAKAMNCRVVVGVSPCKKSGHTLRSLYGQCVQCQPNVLGFHARYRLSGEVYIAYSMSTNLIKVGSAMDADARIQSLNIQGYGRASDWSLEWRMWVEQAAFIEDHIHCKLNEFSVAESFYRGDSLRDCHELFSCSIDTAIDALGRVLIEDHFKRLPKICKPHRVNSTVVPPSKKRTANAAFMKALTPSDALAAIVGANPQSRTEVVSKLWAYIKKNKLQDVVNKRMINANQTLIKLFDKPQVSMFEMADLIGKHLS